MSEIMERQEVRILFPIENRLSLMTGEQSQRRVNVVTTYSVIDPLGLKSETMFQSMATVSTDGSCGHSPSLGVLQLITTSSDNDVNMPTTSICREINPAFAAEYQIEKTQRFIPYYAECEVLDFEGKPIPSTPANPNCEFHEIEGRLPLWQEFEDHMSRASAIADRHPGRVEMPRLEDRDLTPETELAFPIGLRHILGKPILYRIGEDGTHTVWVLVLEDFDQFLPDVIRMDVEAETVDSWLMPRIGINQLFYVDQSNEITFSQTPNSIDPILFEKVTGDTFPSECNVEWQDKSDECREIQISFSETMRTLQQSDLDEDMMAAIWERLPAPLITPAHP